MKNLISFAVALACISSSLATIRTVSNNPSYPAQYTTIPAAINASSAGDTIYIYPSAITYGDPITTSKRLVLIGPGLNPSRPNSLSAIIGGAVTITGASASGFVIMGLQFNGAVTIGDASVSVNNVVFSECKTGPVTQFFCNNILFENNFVSGSGATSSPLQFYGTSQRVIQNNILDVNIGLADGDALVRNNVFANTNPGSYGFIGLTWSSPGVAAIKIHNNIFFKTNPVGAPYFGGGYFCAPCEYKNNIYHLTNNPPPTNAISSGNLNADPQFVNYPLSGAAFSFGFDYHLQPSSPGRNYGTDGKDIGMWGGVSPVNAGFEPPIPRIYELQVNNSNVPAGGTMQLTIKATRAQ